MQSSKQHTATTEDRVLIQYSTLERLYLIGIALTLLVFMAWLSWQHFNGIPPAPALVILALIELPFIWLVIHAYKYELRADNNEIYYREKLAQRILLDEVEKIRVASKVVNLPDLGLSMQHTNIEITGKNKRILISWRSNKLKPLLNFLEAKFPEKIELVEYLPDV